MRLRQRALVSDRRIEGGEIDHAHWLRAEYERVVANAVTVNFRRNRGRADIVETFLRVHADTAVEQMSGHDVDRILQPAPQREYAAGAIVGVARRPEILRACGTTMLAGENGAPAAAYGTDRRQRDRVVTHERVGLQAGLQRCQVGERLHCRTGLTLGLRGAVELAQGVGETPGHGQDAPGLVLQYQGRALHGWSHAQLRLTAGGSGNSGSVW